VLINEIIKEYASYYESFLSNRRIKHVDIKALISKLDPKIFQIKVSGHSFEQREIYLIKFGSGKKKLFFWSQMHGNEATATRALFDFMNFLSSYDEFNEFRKKISESFSLYFLPMLNPDGAERFIRRNAVNIDLNRDAKEQQSPESRILWEIRNSIDPDYGFNLHDQVSKYNVGETENNSKISFLAPAADVDSKIPPNRKLAMEMIAYLRAELEKKIKGHVSIYNDTFSPRCFGDQFQMSKMPTILIESGYNHQDLEREEIRKLNFYIYVLIIDGILTDKISMYKTEDYQTIAMNKEKFFDSIIRSAKFQIGNHKYMMDIAYLREEINNEAISDFYSEYIIEDLGDLDSFYGHDEFDASSYDVRVGKCKKLKLNEIEKLSKKDELNLIKEGFTSIKADSKFDPVPYKRKLMRYSESDSVVEVSKRTDLLFSINGIVEKAFINGKLIDLD
jgi:murein tripeptide amidase MpaA